MNGITPANHRAWVKDFMGPLHELLANWHILMIPLAVSAVSRC